MARRRFHFRRRCNPSFADFRNTLPIAAWGIGGGVGAQWLTRLVLGVNDRGWIGVAANAAATLVLSMAAGRMNRTAGQGVMIGGSILTVGRAIGLLTGQNLASFGTVPGLGAYGPYAFQVPTHSMRALPAAVASSGTVVKPASGGNGMAAYNRGRRRLGVA